MKRNLAIATVAAAVLIGGGTASAVAFTDGGGSSESRGQAADGDRTGGHVDDDDTPDQPGRANANGNGGDERDGGDRGERADTDNWGDLPPRWNGDTDGWDDDADDREDGEGRGGGEGRDDRQDLDDLDDTAEDRALREAKVSLGQAVDAARKARPGTVVSIDLDAEGGRALWDVDILGSDGHWYDLELDGNTGKVVHQHRAHEDDAAALKDALKGAKVSAIEAARDALRATRGTVVSVDLDDGRLTDWDVEVLGADGKGRELSVDLASGKVTWHLDDDHDRHDD